MSKDKSRLRDVLRAINRIAEETAPGRVALSQDAKLQVWVIYHLQVVGEASRGLSREFRERFPDPIWSKVIGLRNILVHHYFEIEEDLIWQVVEHDLPTFRETVEAALRKLDEL